MIGLKQYIKESLNENFSKTTEQIIKDHKWNVDQIIKNNNIGVSLEKDIVTYKGSKKEIEEYRNWKNANMDGFSIPSKVEKDGDGYKFTHKIMRF